MLVVTPLDTIVRLLPVFAIVLLTGRGDPVRVWIALGITGLLILLGAIRWLTTRYRITADRVELHKGWLNRQRTSVPRDRIRTVDLTAKLVHRIFGLSVVRVSAAAGSHAGLHQLDLDAVDTAEAEGLRRELLALPVPAPDGSAEAPAPAAPPAEELARLDPSWVRYAPLTVSSLAGIGLVLGAVWRLFDDLGVDPRDVPTVDTAADRLAEAPVWVGTAVVGVVLLVIAVVGSVLLFIERWWNYRLTREADGTLRVRRGLLTRRSLSVSGRRLRGVLVSEPLLLRAGRGAQARAVSTGLAEDTHGGALQPPAPRAEAGRVAAVVLHEDPSMIVGAPLRRHPRAALTRRLTRVLGSAVGLIAAAWLVAALLPGLAWLGPVSLALLPIALLLGLDRYRSLGHALTARYLVARQGSLHRRTVALQRTGVIGWTFRQSVFQRRAGLVTVQAVTAAGDGGYRVLDIAAADGAALADATTPDLLDPVHHTHRGVSASGGGYRTGPG
ncbi:hypothetical protein PA7_17010 [Pseudonocardia asaccharolytica DSM 44247 = NBRC 16224]|uniref:YdbS-like PH domain-containing protein n=2 Tax=Pseudonocardia asaccharolytica TaxID=54010 RepID=A0A511D2R4_9PSEU|nr:hypothetical protein PA7_17010 [Pseudonocardia asaccharolytica DSM 44247 = NBRC 16224]